MRILGTGSCLPERVVTNEELTKFLDTSDEWIRTRTGIESRHVLTDEPLSFLAGEAARRALADADVGAEDIELILCTTVQGEDTTPALAAQIQREIGASCPAVDINGACAGFIYALDMAEAYIASGKAKRLLIVSAEEVTRLCDWTDRSTCVLFGDGAAAVVAGEGEGLMAACLGTSSNEGVLYARPHPGNSPFRVGARPYEALKMQGQEVYKFAVSTSCADLTRAAEKAGVALEEIDLFLLHQANKRILEAVRARLKIDEERFPHNIERTGNTSSASVPLLLDELNREGRLKDGQLLAMSAFGAGLSTGACILRWNAGK